MKKKFLLICFLMTAVVAFGQNNDWLTKVQGSYNEETGQKMIREIQGSSLSDRELYLGIIYHNLMDYDPDAYLEPALDNLKKASENSPLGLGYYGSVLTKQGGMASDNGNIFKASSLVEEGFRAIDKAVSLAPDDINLRILRMENGLSVSKASPFKRYDTVREDLAWMKPRLETLSPGLQVVYYYTAGEMAWLESDIDTALTCFNIVTETMPESPQADWAREYLNMLEE